jgi:hypothetical protein
MDFPATWVVLQLDQFDSALPDIEGDITVELLAHLRSSGRALDHFRFSLNGSTPLEATVGLENIIPVQDFVGWNITHQIWARDVPLRRNMTGLPGSASRIPWRETTATSPLRTGREFRRQSSRERWSASPAAGRSTPQPDGRW